MTTQTTTTDITTATITASSAIECLAKRFAEIDTKRKDTNRRNHLQYIRKIDGIKVLVFFNTTTDNKYSNILVESWSLYHPEDFDENEEEDNIRLYWGKCLELDETKSLVENYTHNLTKHIAEIKSLRFHNYEGKFQTYAEKTYNEGDLWSAIFPETETTIETYIGKECCVCDKRTTRELASCPHIVCVRCSDQIKVIWDDEKECQIRPCPLCREDIYYRR